MLQLYRFAQRGSLLDSLLATHVTVAAAAVIAGDELATHIYA